jgi:hypothetical protein
MEGYCQSVVCLSDTILSEISVQITIKKKCDKMVDDTVKKNSDKAD